MNLKDKNAKFSVYEHVSPDGKRYVGITSKPVHQRWLGGIGYKDNAHFWNAIQKYGWDNFEHNVIASSLSLIEACNLEVELIAKYDLINPDNGYNHTTGGNWSSPDEATRKKLSESIKRSRNRPEVRAKMSASLKGHPVSAETRRKLSEANKGRKLTEEQCAARRGRKLSPEQVAKMKGRPNWIKGLTAETDERVRRLAEKSRGRKHTKEARENMSRKQKARFANGFAPKWINNGQIEKQIQRNEPVPAGYELGRLSILNTYIFKGEISKKIRKEDLDDYIKQGWQLGRPNSVKENVRKSLQTMHWEYGGIRFETAKALAIYLRENGYPKIVDSTITSLYRKGFDKSPTYSSLAGKVVKVLHEN